jgi:hypothetical protein
MSGRQGSFKPARRAPRPIDEYARIGHMNLRTADINRVRTFYVDILGFDLIFEARDVPGWGTTGDILFLSAGGCHHHLGFNTWLSADGEPQEHRAQACTTSRTTSPRRPNSRRSSSGCSTRVCRCDSSPTTPHISLSTCQTRQQPRARLGPAGRVVATRRHRRRRFLDAPLDPDELLTATGH